MKNRNKHFGAWFGLLITAFSALVIGTILAGCASLTVVGIDSGSVTGPKQVRQYGTINPNDVTVYAYYKDDSRKPVSSKTIADFDNSRVGTQTVTVRISGGFTATFETEVKALTGITITAQPSRVKAALLPLGGGNSGSQYPGLEVQGTWDSMGTASVNASECQVTGIDITKAGRQTGTLAYKGKQTAFTVEVVALQSIRIESAPTKVTYIQGESFDRTGLKVMGVYPGIGEDDVTALVTIAGFNSQNVGRQNLTVSFFNRTANFSIQVMERPDPALNGTWTTTQNGGIVYTLNNGTYQQSNDQSIIAGTYTTSGGKITFTATHSSGAFLNQVITAYKVEAFEFEPTKLYSKDEITNNADIPQATKTALLNGFNALRGTVDYSINGNTLQYGQLTYTKQ
jgi:hypothetical protein